MRRLETERLLLRPLTDEDFEDFFDYLSDRELVRMYYGLAGSVDRETASHIFSSFRKGEKTYALEHKQDNKMIGHLIVTALELSEQNANMLGSKRGITVAFAVAPNYQRKGLITEALQKVITDLLEEKGYDYIHCGYFDFNLASEELQKKLGFRFLTSQTVKTSQGEITIIHNILYR